MDSSNVPRTAEGYRAWWQANTDAPYGSCWCGCGNKTEIAKENRLAWGIVQGEPKRYIHGHSRVNQSAPRTAEQHREYWRANTSVSYGYCWCNCGSRTTLALQSSGGQNTVKGEPTHWLTGHCQRAATMGIAEDNSSGVCWCGCGEPTARYSRSNLAQGQVRGHYAKYARHHSPNTKLSEQRKQEICTRYQEGDPAWLLSEEYDISEASVYGHLRRRGTPVRARSGWIANIQHIRSSGEYTAWRSAVLERDGCTCQHCDRKHARHAHHIKPFAEIVAEHSISSPEEAFECAALWDTQNGLTLCIGCHKRVHSRAASLANETR